MEQVTYRDIIEHYWQKTVEMHEDTEELYRKTTIAMEILDTAWKGKNAAFLQEKIEKIRHQYLQAEENLSRAIDIFKYLCDQIEK